MAFGIDDIIGSVLGIVNKFIPDPAQQAQAEASLRATLLAWDQAQISVNQSEAQSGSKYVAGWRPFIGWCCGIGIAYTYLLVPFTMYFGLLFGFDIPKPPVLDNNLWELMCGMLGLSGLRTYEKVQGKTK